MRPDLTRDEHLSRICGSGVGPDVWREAQQRRAALAAQSKTLAVALHQIAEIDRPALAAQAREHAEAAHIGAMLERGDPWHEVAARARAIRPDPEELARLTAPPDDDTTEDERAARVVRLKELKALRRFKSEIAAVPWTAVPNDDPVELVGLVTGQRTALDPVRRLREIPIVASSARRPMLSALTHFIEHVCSKDYKGETYARYFVITNGRRVGWHEDPQLACRRFQRRISKVAVWAAEQGVDFIYRGVEVTLNDDGGHIHANVLAVPRSQIGRIEWGMFLAELSEQIGARINDAGRVKDLREVVKYVCKPADVQREILDHPDRLARLRWLHRMHYRTRISTPLGAFKEHWAALNADRLKVAVIDQKTLLVPKSDPRDPIDDDDDKPKRRSDRPNRIMGYVLANRIHTPWAEPSILVKGGVMTEAEVQRAFGDQSVIAQQSIADARKILDLESAAMRAWIQNDGPEPAVAVAVAAAWRASDSDSDAQKVRALVKKSDRPDLLSTLDNTHLTVRSQSDIVTIGRGPPGLDPPVWPDQSVIRPDEAGYDPETGEIFKVAQGASGRAA